jgi:serine/threonine protein phosphatase PrpC
VDRAEIERLLDRADDASVRALFEAAMAAGGDDNVSLILLRIERAPPTP